MSAKFQCHTLIDLVRTENKDKCISNTFILWSDRYITWNGKADKRTLMHILEMMRNMLFFCLIVNIDYSLVPVNAHQWSPALAVSLVTTSAPSAHTNSTPDLHLHMWCYCKYTPLEHKYTDICQFQTKPHRVIKTLNTLKRFILTKLIITWQERKHGFFP